MNLTTTTQEDQTISLHQCDFDLLQMVAQQRGLNENDLETALQLILREWLEMQEELLGVAFPVASTVDLL
jgi:hypothetical protein